jgi:hypothetical protein
MVKRKPYVPLDELVVNVHDEFDKKAGCIAVFRASWCGDFRDGYFVPTGNQRIAVIVLVIVFCYRHLIFLLWGVGC